jgi:hypothetical protein
VGRAIAALLPIPIPGPILPPGLILLSGLIVPRGLIPRARPIPLACPGSGRSGVGLRRADRARGPGGTR